MDFWKWKEQTTDGYELGMSGFSPQQVHAFQSMRRAYAVADHRTAEYRRLEFIRWLVTTGRLTDEIRETR